MVEEMAEDMAEDAVEAIAVSDSATVLEDLQDSRERLAFLW